jgi:hypothetical protein
MLRIREAHLYIIDVSRPNLTAVVSDSTALYLSIQLKNTIFWKDYTLPHPKR